ncbi:MAG: Holliday junction branch migration protein RuvA [Cyanobacteria bacterium]|nr:Holliday junction branch migration protein RuvA [Cyanobacteriota bacterium]
MYTFIKGQLAHQSANSPKGAFWWVDVNGLGLEIATTEAEVHDAGWQIGDSVLIYTALIVREDNLSLVGFATRSKRDLFHILQTASGVGVKVALSLLNHLSVSEIVQAVLAEDHKPLTQAKGVGPKLAQKMTLELKEKMTQWHDTADSSLEQFQIQRGKNGEGAFDDAGKLTPAQLAAYQEAQSVMYSLGYTSEEVSKSFQNILSPITSKQDINADFSSEWILKEALRWLAKHV